MLQEQVELQARNHSEAENYAARRRCREFLEGGWGSIDWIEVYEKKWLDVDRCHEVYRRVGFEPRLTLQVNLNGVPHYLSDVGDGDIDGVHPFGVAMAEWIRGELFAFLLGVIP